jgi:hypothetical protein
LAHLPFSILSTRGGACQNASQRITDTIFDAPKGPWEERNAFAVHLPLDRILDRGRDHGPPVDDSLRGSGNLGRETRHRLPKDFHNFDFLEPARWPDFCMDGAAGAG